MIGATNSERFEVNEKLKKIIVQGAENPGDLPGFEQIEGKVQIEFAMTEDELRQKLPGCEVLLGWDFRGNALANAWSAATDLKWIHWCGAGVDAVLFPELQRSDVALTNARGLFDRPIAEYVLGLVIAMAKGFVRTCASQAEGNWDYRLAEMIEEKEVLVVGVGSIGRHIAKLLGQAGMCVSGIGRTARSGDAEFDNIYAITELGRRLPQADYVVSVLPLTRDTTGVFSAVEFGSMKSTARFINVGRGASVNESDLVKALQDGVIAGAALDVFQTEPLPADSPLWSTPNLIISPHMSGDYVGYYRTMFDQFVSNFYRFERGEVLHNVVDKQAGFVPSDR